MKKQLAIGMFTSLLLVAALPTTAYAAQKAKVTPISQQIVKLDINKATVEQLTSLKGIGTAKAKAIVEYRSKINGFTHIDDLKEVKGIGEKLVRKLESQISF